MDAFPVQISAITKFSVPAYRQLLSMTLPYLGFPTLNHGWDLLPVTGDRVESLGDQHLVWWEGLVSKHFMKCDETVIVVESGEGEFA